MALIKSYVFDGTRTPEILRAAWGDRPCEHNQLTAILENDYKWITDRRVLGYFCRVCGHRFSAADGARLGGGEHL